MSTVTVKPNVFVVVELEEQEISVLAVFSQIFDAHNFTKSLKPGKNIFIHETCFDPDVKIARSNSV